MFKERKPISPLMINVDGLNDDIIIDLFKTMLLIRKTELRIAQRIQEKKIYTPCHLYVGQEACAVGVCSSLNKDDFVFTNHRSHGHFLAKCKDVKALFAEVYCRESGCSGGRGGSMHLCNPEFGLLGSTSIVGGVMGIGVGPALKSKVLGLDNVSVIFHGDCVPEEGIWHESLNFACVNKLPVIYVCENNLYAASAPLENRRVFDNIHKIAQEHGCETYVVDGNDIFAVKHFASSAIEKARKGFGPQFLELRTYRWLGHVGPRDDIDVGLRDLDELNHWKNRCPIKFLEKYLKDNNILNDKAIGLINLQIETIVEEAENLAINAKKPNPKTLLEDIYHGE